MNSPFQPGGAPRRQRFHRGRWQLERERFQIEAREPPRPQGEPARLGQLAATQAAQILRRMAASRQTGIADHWREVTDPPVHAQTRLGTLERGVLTVYVRNNVWLHEIRRFHQKSIENALRLRMPDTFKNLRLRLDPDGG